MCTCVYCTEYLQFFSAAGFVCRQAGNEKRPMHSYCLLLLIVVIALFAASVVAREREKYG